MLTSRPLHTATAPWAETGSALSAKKVRLWWQRAQQAYPPNTLRAWRADWAVFLAYCERDRLIPLPASAETVAGFVGACRANKKKPATTQRYLSTLTLAHRVAGLANTVSHEAVQLELKGYRRAVSVRQQQAHPLVWAEIRAYLDLELRSLRGLRDAALLCVAYDTMARRSELVALNIEDLDFLGDGTGRALIQRSKTDPSGEGNQAYLSRETVRQVLRWREEAGCREGPLFRRLVGRYQIGNRLGADSVSELYKAVAAVVGLPAEQIRTISGHSIRVGATQDLLALNIDLASVMQAGRWASARMPMRYGEHVLAARGAMARAAGAQGRDCAVL